VNKICWQDRVCFYGGPGSGKSVAAMAATVQLKSEGWDKVEYVPEVVKEYAYRLDKLEPWEQLLCLGQQMKNEEKLLNYLYTVVTDAPPAQMLAYVLKDMNYLYVPLKKVVQEFEGRYRSKNYFVQRRHPYRESGRFQAEEDALKMDQLVLGVMTDLKIEYEVYPGSVAVSEFPQLGGE
jgi:hypothetical protein